MEHISTDILGVIFLLTLWLTVYANNMLDGLGKNLYRAETMSDYLLARKAHFYVSAAFIVASTLVAFTGIGLIARFLDWFMATQ